MCFVPLSRSLVHFYFICSWFSTPVCVIGLHPVGSLVVVIAVFWWQKESNQTTSVNSAGELVWWCAPENSDGFNGRLLRRWVVRVPKILMGPMEDVSVSHDSEASDGFKRRWSVAMWGWVL